VLEAQEIFGSSQRVGPARSTYNASRPDPFERYREILWLAVRESPSWAVRIGKVAPVIR